MAEILIFRHLGPEGPGYLADVLARHGLPFRIVAIDAGEPVPQSTEGVAGLVFMGGPMSVNDPLPWIEAECHLIRQAVAADLPVLGHCLGGQLISRALGAPVTRNPVKEIGWLPVARVETPAAQVWLRGLPARFEVFHWHGETFALPPGAELLLRSEQCAHQAYVLGSALALQCHVEMQADMVRSWAVLGAEEIAQPTATVQSAAQMAQDLEARIAALQRIADVLYGPWLAAVTARLAGGRSGP